MVGLLAYLRFSVRGLSRATSLHLEGSWALGGKGFVEKGFQLAFMQRHRSYRGTGARVAARVDRLGSQEGFQAGRNKTPCPHVLRFFLAPDNPLGRRIARNDFLKQVAAFSAGDTQMAHLAGHGSASTEARKTSLVHAL